MKYSINVYRYNEGLVFEVTDLPTRYDLAQVLDSLLIRFPRPLHEFSITGSVTKSYTLLDGDIENGYEATDKLRAFMEAQEGR